jgi:hypothetical protein
MVKNNYDYESTARIPHRSFDVAPKLRRQGPLTTVGINTYSTGDVRGRPKSKPSAISHHILLPTPPSSFLVIDHCVPLSTLQFHGTVVYTSRLAAGPHNSLEKESSSKQKKNCGDCLYTVIRKLKSGWTCRVRSVDEGLSVSRDQQSW